MSDLAKSVLILVCGLSIAFGGFIVGLFHDSSWAHSLVNRGKWRIHRRPSHLWRKTLFKDGPSEDDYELRLNESLALHVWHYRGWRWATPYHWGDAQGIEKTKEAAMLAAERCARGQALGFVAALEERGEK